MELLPARKTRPALVVELLEDRRLPSQMALAPVWDHFARPVGWQAETAPLSSGPVNPGGDPSSGSNAMVESRTVVCSVSPALSAPAGGLSTESISQPQAAAVENSDIGPTPKPTETEIPASSGPLVEPATRGSRAQTEPIASPPASIPPALVSRAETSFSLGRSPSELVLTSARFEASSTPTEPGPVSPGLTLPVVGLVGAASSTAAGSSPEPVRGQVTTTLPLGPAPAAVPITAVALPASVTRGGVGVAAAPEVPIVPEDARSSDVGFAPNLERATESQPELSDPTNVPEPALAEMIQSFLPFDHSVLDRAINQFLEPLDGLTSSMPELRGPIGLIAASLAVSVSVVAVEVALRLRRVREQEQGGPDGVSPVVFPGL